MTIGSIRPIDSVLQSAASLKQVAAAYLHTIGMDVKKARYRGVSGPSVHGIKGKKCHEDLLVKSTPA